MGWLIKKLTHPRFPRVQSTGFFFCKFIFSLGLLYAALSRVYYFKDTLYIIGLFETPFIYSWLDLVVDNIRSQHHYLIGFECLYILSILINMLLLRSAWSSSFLFVMQLLNITVFFPCNTASELLAHYFLILFFFTDLSKIHSNRRFRVLHFLVGIRAIQLQMAIMYFFSGFIKLLNTAWYKGIALNLIFKMDYITKYDFQILDRLPIINTIFTYAVLVFECFFFTMLIVPRLRPFFITFGITMHLLIGLFIAYLWDLSLISISLYCLFIDWKRLLSSLLVKSILNFSKKHLNLKHNLN